MMVKHSLSIMGYRPVTLFIVTMLLVLMLVITLSPIYIVAVNSFKTTQDFYETGPFGFPKSPTLEIMATMWRISDFSVRILNSVIISIVTTFLVIGLSLLNSYALGIGRPRHINHYLVFIMLVMTLPAGALVYPRFYALRTLGLYNTRIAIIAILVVTHMAFGTYFLTSVFKGFPREFIEAAELDGISKISQLLRIVAPLNMPSMTVLSVFIFIWSWNEFYTPLIFLSSASKMTVPLAILLARVPMAEPQITNLTAISFLSMIPCIVFFAVFRSYLRRGITFSGIKG